MIGRAGEIEQTIEILSRRTKNNPVLIGDPGSAREGPSIPAAAALGLRSAREVSFAAPEARWRGWYVPGSNGAAVIVMHGSHGSRADTARYVRMLASAGYGVLAFDARGHGASSGQTNALGWRGRDDVAAAVSFLGRQRGVDPRRIAALGLSMGAEEALRSAATAVRLRAVIADGAGASTAGDSQLADTSPVATSVTWLSMRATELFAGESEPPALKSIVSRIKVPVLLIASSAANERRIDQAYAERIGSEARLWYLADTGHTRGLQQHPRAYSTQVRQFLAESLGRQR